MPFRNRLHSPSLHTVPLTHVSRSLGNQSIPNNAATNIAWDTEHFDGERVYPSVNWGAPFLFGDNQTGVWVVQVNLAFVANIAGIRRVGFVNAVGGQQDERQSVQAVQVGPTYFTITTIVSLAGSGVGTLGLAVEVLQDSGAALDVIGAAGFRARLKTWRLSRNEQ